MSLRLAAFTLLAFVACAKTEPAVQIAPPADSSASPRASGSIGASVAAPVDAGGATGASPDAGGDSGPARADLEPACAGAAIDLTTVLLDGLCEDGTEGVAVPAGALRASVAAPSRLAPGAEGITTITWTNTTGAPLDLYVAVPPPSLDGPGIGFGLGGGARVRDSGAKPKEARTVPVGQSTTSADGKRTFNATWSMLTARSQTAHVRLAAAGTLLFRTTLRARGFLPSKTYGPDLSVNDPPDPLPVGRYRVTLLDPIWRKAAESPSVDLDVRK